MQQEYFYGATQSNGQPDYQYQQSPAAPPKKDYKPIILVIILTIAVIGLLIYIVVDKFIFRKSDIVVLEESSRVDLVPLTEIDLDSVPLQKALAGRIFAVNTNYREYIKFVSDEKYEFHYLREPEKETPYLIPSIDNGTYTVIDRTTIKLSNEESFKLVHGYLIKTTEKLSKNINTVYFDYYHLATTSQRLDDALTTYVEKLRSANTTNARVELAHVDLSDIYCNAGTKYINDQDNGFSCTSSYTYFFNQKTINDTLESKQIDTFSELCTLPDSGFARYAFGDHTCQNDDYSIDYYSQYIIKVNSDHTYKVTELKDGYQAS